MRMHTRPRLHCLPHTRWRQRGRRLYPWHFSPGHHAGEGEHSDAAGSPSQLVLWRRRKGAERHRKRRIHESLQEEPHILLECDASILDSLQKHLKLYKIRRKVNIMPCPDLSLWAVIPKEQSEEGTGELQQCPSKAVVVTPDPRVAVMGWRLITSKGTDPLEVVPGSQIGNMKDYHRHRYKQGIPEGVKDLPSGTALPLESNLAYMNGISFTKGCYIGQELTARTHHMGVIRKRLLPIQLSTPVPSESIFEGAEIVSESGKSAGKYRAGVDNLGIALLRLANMNEPLRLKIPGDLHASVTASIPKWWPNPASK
ncbi:putative transferase CAF17, mitochondrial isoform X2 [Rhineura floridana]|uniref:putative transferase CAF17, mitochondrial isoform X2 n=1 Tax=Rhineura floridana TaxID=261503 RepID=UPI002AC82700|nr:putative transferase CAF17, mitochondrial isoform X2 [Rhineura floridana]